MKVKNLFFLLLSFACLYSCKTKQAGEKPVVVKKVIQRTKPAADITYHFENSKSWLKQHKENDAVLRNVLAVNRTDLSHLRGMDSIIIPNEATADIAYYLPFPFHLSYAGSIDKIIFFSYPSQSFAAYENGELIYTGPTNMGRKADPTATGLYFTNWKAEKTTSTSNDEWELKWNFNIDNKEGVGWHQYDMPGYPASHSCLRLQEADARYLYDWADQWVLDHDSVKFKGTPVIVFGSYDFGAPKPWLKLATDPHALDISEKAMEEILALHLKQIMSEQEKRKAVGK